MYKYVKMRNICACTYSRKTANINICTHKSTRTFLGWVIGFHLIIPIGGTTDTESGGLALHVITVTGGGDGVQTIGIRLAILLVDTC
jgi:hypothetical protein